MWVVVWGLWVVRCGAAGGGGGGGALEPQQTWGSRPGPRGFGLRASGPGAQWAGELEKGVCGGEFLRASVHRGAGGVSRDRVCIEGQSEAQWRIGL